ncbi:hypothetical protein ACLX1H_011311 [Fusarium chlamydosporum]
MAINMLQQSPGAPRQTLGAITPPPSEPCQNPHEDGRDEPVIGLETCEQRGSSDSTLEWGLLAFKYLAEANNAIEAAKQEFLTQHTRAPHRSRSDVDAPIMSHLLTTATSGRPISAEDAVGYVYGSKGHRDAFVLCTMTEATWLLAKGPPSIPILVVDALSPQHRMPISAAFSKLRTGGELDVHDFKQVLEKNQTTYAPKRLAAQKAIDLFNARRNGAGLPVNLLNIGCLRIDNTPQCFLHNDYTALRTRTNAKAEAPEWKDLDDCTAFQLLASKGAAHLPHVDRHGVYTTALNEEGKKLWLLWPGLSLPQQKQMSDYGKIADGGVGILIEEGSMLIQPPNTLHAPITLEDCLMTGDMPRN